MIAAVYANLSDTERNWGDATRESIHYEAALSYMQESLSASRKLPGDDVPTRRDVADSQISIGRILGPLGRFDEAERYYLAALPEFERLAATDRDNLEARQDLANLYNYRGETLAMAGRAAEAERWTHRYLAV